MSIIILDNDILLKTRWNSKQNAITKTTNWYNKPSKSTACNKNKNVNPSIAKMLVFIPY